MQFYLCILVTTCRTRLIFDGAHEITDFTVQMQADVALDRVNSRNMEIFRLCLLIQC